jgi:hypothetical protein
MKKIFFQNYHVLNGLNFFELNFGCSEFLLCRYLLTVVDFSLQTKHMFSFQFLNLINCLCCWGNADLFQMNRHTAQLKEI